MIDLPEVQDQIAESKVEDGRVRGLVGLYLGQVESHVVTDQTPGRVLDLRPKPRRVHTEALEQVLVSHLYVADHVDQAVEYGAWISTVADHHRDQGLDPHRHRGVLVLHLAGWDSSLGRRCASCRQRGRLRYLGGLPIDPLDSAITRIFHDHTRIQGVEINAKSRVDVQDVLGRNAGEVELVELVRSRLIQVGWIRDEVLLEAPAVVPRFEVAEFVVRVKEPPFQNPFTDTELAGVFTADNASLRVAGFADSPDGSVFRLRFVPATVATSYRYELTLKGNWIDRRFTGTFRCVPSCGDGPVVVDPARPKHFMHAGSRRPFYHLGFTAYHLLDPSNDDAQVDATIDYCARHGFNKIRFRPGWASRMPTTSRASTSPTGSELIGQCGGCASAASSPPAS